MPPRDGNRGGIEAANIRLSILELTREKDLPSNTEPGQSRGQDPHRPLKESIRLNLDWVLNTRCAIGGGTDPKKREEYAAQLRRLEDLTNSMFVYGVRDLAGSRFDSADEYRELRNEIKKLIALFEPRLNSIEVGNPEHPQIGTLRFRIDAKMLVDPEPEKVNFDIETSAGSTDYRIKADDR